MAKKITNLDGETAETLDAPETRPETTEPPSPDPDPEKEVSQAQAPADPEPQAAKPAEVGKPSDRLPEHADRILRANSSYAELYIDPQGGTFTANTPPALRRTATLYKNPYHKRP